MGPLAYLDQNMFSNLLKPEVKRFDDIFPRVGLTVVFSWVHLFEMRHNIKIYGDLLDHMGAMFVCPRESDNLAWALKPRAESGNAIERLADLDANRGVVEAFEATFASLHHLMGGQRDRTPQQIANGTRAKFDLLVIEPLRKELAEDPRASASFGPKLHEMEATLASATKSIGTIQPEADWALMDQQWISARKGDPMRDMNSLQKVDFLLGLLPTAERKAFEHSFPPNFAKDGRFEANKVTGLAMGLFGMGLTKRKALFSGASQEKNFHAQVMDTCHIEAAAVCETFFTFDKGAADLANATYAYAGIPTKVFCMTMA